MRKPNYKSYLSFELRNQMIDDCMSPALTEKLSIDGKVHSYDITKCGSNRKAYYEATFDRFGKRKSLTLIANYGIENSSQRKQFVMSA